MADIAKLSVGREAYYTRELATDHEAYLCATPRPRSSSTGAPISSSPGAPIRSQVADPERALGTEPRSPGQRADRQRVRSAIERVHAKQRATDRTRDTEPTSERPIQSRPHQQRGQPGPERAAG